MSHPSHCFSLAFAFNCRLPFLRRELITVFIFSCLHFHINFFPTNLQFRGCSMTLMLMAYITLLFHNSACFLKTWSAHFADAPTVSYSYPCLHSAVIQNFDLTKRDAKRPKISKLIPSKVFSHNLTAQPEDGYPQSRRCKQTAAKELHKRGRADVGKRNCSPVYHWGTVRCQDVIGGHWGGTMKGTRSRQHVRLPSLTFEQGQAGRAAVFSRIRRFRSSLFNPSRVFFLNKPAKTHSRWSHCALYTTVRAFVRHSQSFLRICRSHFRKDPHFVGFFFFKPPYEANTTGLARCLLQTITRTNADLSCEQ